MNKHIRILTNVEKLLTTHSKYRQTRMFSKNACSQKENVLQNVLSGGWVTTNKHTIMLDDDILLHLH